MNTSYITAQNALNLRILHKFLSDNYAMVDEHLDMQQFCSHAVRPRQAKTLVQDEDFNECSTTLCLAGWSAVLPEFTALIDEGESYAVTLQKLYGTDESYVFWYLFSEDWENDLDAGLKRLDRLCTAVEQDDSGFLNYLAIHWEEIRLVHCDEDYKDIDGEDFYSLAEAKAEYPLYNTPDWY